MRCQLLRPRPLWERASPAVPCIRLGEGLPAGENPSSGADCIRATFSHKGRREAGKKGSAYRGAMRVAPADGLAVELARHLAFAGAKSIVRLLAAPKQCRTCGLPSSPGADPALARRSRGGWPAGINA